MDKSKKGPAASVSFFCMSVDDSSKHFVIVQYEVKFVRGKTGEVEEMQLLICDIIVGGRKS